jgi:hypothetical protein
MGQGVGTYSCEQHAARFSGLRASGCLHSKILGLSWTRKYDGPLSGRTTRMRSLGSLGRLFTRINALHLVLGLGGSVGMVTSATGCRVDEQDLARWETTQRGPDKISSVIIHDKYDMNLRVEAALSLVRMPARGGRFVGIDILTKSLGSTSAAERDKIVAGLVPAMVGELKKDPPAAQAGQPAPPDPSFPFKDASFALLTAENPVLLTDDKLRADLRQALIDWSMKDFERRLENRNQKTGMEQLMRFLGADGVKGLPEKITRESRQLDKIASLVDELGTPSTREAASAKYVEIARWIVTQQWLDAKKPVVEAANSSLPKPPTADEFKAQLETYQDEEFARLLGALKRVGGRAAIDFCLEFSADAKAKKERRMFAMAALELRLDPKNAEDLKRVFAIATSDAPAEVLDLAFRRIGEMPREAVIDRLYEAFKLETKWKVRRSAASIVLKMATEAKHLEEFFGKLPADKDPKNFARGEAINYGAMVGDLTTIKPEDMRKLVDKYLPEPAPLTQRVTAASFYLVHGKPEDIKTLTPFELDKMALPVCDPPDEDCKWSCFVPKEGKPSESELREIKTFGEYVKLCVGPGITDRAKAKQEQDSKEKK